MMKKLALSFGSYTKAQEILLLRKGVKPVVRQGFYQPELPAIERYCLENKLHLVTSTFKVLLADYTPYSNKGIRVPAKDKREGMFFVYISNDEEKAWLAAYYELMNNHKDLGAVLGYPACCVDYFMKAFSAKNPNPVHSPTNAWTNLTQRDNDAVLISHFPCSSDCQESMVLARKTADVIAKHDTQRVRHVLRLLQVKKDEVGE